MTHEHEDEFTSRPELVKKRARAEVWSRVGLAIMVVYCMLSLTMLTYASVLSLQQRNAIISCTTPQGSCYKEGQRRTSVILDEIARAGNNRSARTRRIVVLAVTCGQRLGPGASADDVTNCVQRELRKGN